MNTSDDRFPQLRSLAAHCFLLIAVVLSAFVFGCENNQTMQRINAVNDGIEHVNQHAQEIQDAADLERGK